MAYNPTHPDWCGCYDCRLFARAEEITRDSRDSDGGWEPYDVRLRRAPVVAVGVVNVAVAILAVALTALAITIELLGRRR